jgi:hypothetical protein
MGPPHPFIHMAGIHVSVSCPPLCRLTTPWALVADVAHRSASAPSALARLSGEKSPIPLDAHCSALTCDRHGNPITTMPIQPPSSPASYHSVAAITHMPWVIPSSPVLRCSPAPLLVTAMLGQVACRQAGRSMSPLATTCRSCDA